MNISQLSQFLTLTYHNRIALIQFNVVICRLRKCSAGKQINNPDLLDLIITKISEKQLKSDGLTKICQSASIKKLNTYLWRDLKMAVHRRSPSKLIELEMICKEEWEKLPKDRCAKLVASYSRRLEAVIAAKGASTTY